MNNSNRDNFSPQTKRSLAERVGFRCSNPDCRAPTSGPQITNSKSVNVGVAAHVSAAAPGGPRYDPALSTKERAAITNGIWLCQNCAKLVDNDPNRFTADLLRQWKELSEQKALNNVGKSVPNSGNKQEIVDKWVSTTYVEKAGIVDRLQQDGYELCWTAAEKESERIDLEGWEPVFFASSGWKACSIED